MAAAGRGDLAGVEAELARDRALARAGNETGDTALHHAAKNGHLRVVRALLAAGANVDAVRGDGYRPVHCALMPNWFFQVRLGSREKIAELLLSHGARYTIFIAALRGDEQFVRDALTRAEDRTLRMVFIGPGCWCAQALGTHDPSAPGNSPRSSPRAFTLPARLSLTAA
ncbi:MAG: ankyrin repeat domain-containing protein [Gemmatimonadaceae bacterium]